MSDDYGHFIPRPPIGRVKTESGDVVVPSKFSRRPAPFKPLGNMNSVFKAQRVSSSTSPSRDASSETTDDTAQTMYGEHGMSGMDRHMLGMLESNDISQSEANQHFNNYFQ
jgi:hypothetical protein